MSFGFFFPHSTLIKKIENVDQGAGNYEWSWTLFSFVS